MRNSTKPDLKSFIQNDIIKNIEKIKGKHVPFSEIVNNTPKTLVIEKIYDLKKKNKSFTFLLQKILLKHPN